MENIFVTGGAGYIGSVAAKKLTDSGYKVVVIDNLSKGRRELVDSKAEFIVGDLLDKALLRQIFEKYKFDSVMHFAGYKDAGESMENPEKYSKNIVGSINLLEEIVKNNVPQIIFSSSAAVYGDPKYLPIDEDHPTNPTNYYGYTKLKIEEIIQWYARLKGFNYLILRYFNVAGDGGLNYIDPDAKNILPILMEILSEERQKFVVFGNDYETRDGTCVRDYIDVNDLVEAHLMGLNLKSNEIINLGTAKGYSVLELINAVEKVAEKKIEVEIGGRRLGDPASLVADFKKAKKILNWMPKVSLEKMIETTLKSYRKKE